MRCLAFSVVLALCSVWVERVDAAEDVQPPFDIEGGGDYAKARQKSGEWGGVPAVFRTPETGLGVGAVLIYLPRKDQEAVKASSVLLGGVITERHQALASLYTEQYLGHDQWVAELYLAVQDYPDFFFGFGNETNAANQESYSWQQRKGAVSFRWLLTRDLRVGINAVMQQDGFDHVQSGGLLDIGQVPGRSGGRSQGVGGSLRWDTFDDAYSPKRGEALSLMVLHYDRNLGSDYSYDYYEANLKKFFSLAADDVIGAQIYAASNVGDVPFYQLAMLGGKNLLRGYYQGRYRDRNMLVAQTEYRRHLHKQWGGVMFAGAGEVAHDADGFSARGGKSSAGFGLRYQLVEQQRINVRLDFAFARHESNPSVYLYLLEAF